MYVFKSENEDTVIKREDVSDLEAVLVRLYGVDIVFVMPKPYQWKVNRPPHKGEEIGSFECVENQ